MLQTDACKDYIQTGFLRFCFLYFSCVAKCPGTVGPIETEFTEILTIFVLGEAGNRCCGLWVSIMCAWTEQIVREIIFDMACGQPTVG